MFSEKNNEKIDSTFLSFDFLLVGYKLVYENFVRKANDANKPTFSDTGFLNKYRKTS